MSEPGLREQLERHHAASFGWALHCCGRDPVEAEDVLQTAYVKILEGRACFAGRSSFKTWLFEVIRRTAADARRRHWFRKLGFVRYEQGNVPATAGGSPADTLERSQRQLAVQRALSRLSSRQREVLHLVFYQELTVGGAADVMGVSVGSARQHYERGKQRLRERLRSEGGSDE